MTAEVFKSKLSSPRILLAATGQEGIEIVKAEDPDLVMVDFDLPDADGISMVQNLRKVYSKPIFLSVYPDAVVTQAIREELFAFNDSGDFIVKPIQKEQLTEKIDHFVVNGRRIGKRFKVEDVASTIIGKAAGRGKRAPKFEGVVQDLSIGGACVSVDSSHKIRLRSDIVLSMDIPKPTSRGKAATREMRLKATIAWKKKTAVGLEFARLTEVQQKDLENYLRTAQPFEE
jgi:CheY-like chemotaxis protein